MSVTDEGELLVTVSDPTSPRPAAMNEESPERITDSINYQDGESLMSTQESDPSDSLPTLENHQTGAQQDLNDMQSEMIKKTVIYELEVIKHTIIIALDILRPTILNKVESAEVELLSTIFRNNKNEETPPLPLREGIPSLPNELSRQPQIVTPSAEVSNESVEESSSYEGEAMYSTHTSSTHSIIKNINDLIEVEAKQETDVNNLVIISTVPEEDAAAPIVVIKPRTVD